MELQKLPIGEQSFERLRKANFLYVDKTEDIYRLTHEGTYYFLSRPRRFGKSLLLSTIEAYFQGKRDLFDGLYLSQKEKEWSEYPVLHLDFSTQTYRTEQNVYNILNDFLDEYETKYGRKEGETDVALRFKWLVRFACEKTGRGVVILVDEYDKPLLETIGNPELQEKYRGVLRGFYAVLKAMNKYIRFALLTGITKFSKVSIFSDLNNMRDISRTKQFASICGLTDKEVDRDLTPFIRAYAEEVGKSWDVAREDLRRMYDGYHFAADTPGLYNPFSLMNALWWKECRGYWFDTGTPMMLVEMLKRKQYILSNLDESIDTAELDSKDGSGDSIVPLLYQSGYLSIVRSDDSTQQTWLTFPNREVRDGFFKYLLPFYTSVQKERKNAAVDDFVRDIREGNAEQFLLRLQSLYADFQYDAQTTPEAHFRNVLYILCKLIGLQVDAEYQTSNGRIDLLIRTDKYVYVIECKVDSTAQVALQQIKGKGYTLPWALDERQTILVGLNFSTSARRPDGWLIERNSTKCGDKYGDKMNGNVATNQKSGDKSPKKSDDNKRRILEFVSAHTQVKSQEVAEVLNLGISRTKVYLTELVEAGLIIRLGANKDRTYKLKSDAPNSH